MEIVLPRLITYKEIMLVYGVSQISAHKRLWAIRGILGKKQRQPVLVAEFCQAENINAQIFHEELKAAYAKLYQKPQKQLSISYQ